MPDPTVSPLYVGATVTHRQHLEGIVLSLCSDTVSREVKASKCSFLSLRYPVYSGERKRTCEPPLLVVQDPAAPSPFPTPHRPSSSHSLAHEEDTADGCPGVRRGFFFF